MLRFPRTAPAPEPAATAESVRRLAELEVDEDSREVRVDGSVVDLTRTEFDLLAALASRPGRVLQREDRKSTRLNSSHANISYAVFCLKKKNKSHPLTWISLPAHSPYVV